MIAKVFVKLSSENPRMPLRPIAVLKGSSATVTVIGANDRCTAVTLKVTNVAGTSQTYAAVRDSVGWTVTVPASHFNAAGLAQDGFQVWGSGNDEMNTAREWGLGVGDLEVLPTDGTTGVVGNYTSVKVQAGTPGDPLPEELRKINGTWKIYHNGNWEIFGGGTGTVTSVNNVQPVNGNVTIVASDVGAMAQNTDADPVSGHHYTVVFVASGILRVPALRLEQNGPGGVSLGVLMLPHGASGAPIFGTLARIEDIPSLSGYATQQWVQQQGFADATSVAQALALKAPLNSPQFTNGASFGNDSQVNFDTFGAMTFVNSAGPSVSYDKNGICLYDVASGNPPWQVTMPARAGQMAIVSDIPYRQAGSATAAGAADLSQAAAKVTYFKPTGNFAVTLPTVTGSMETVPNLDLVVDARDLTGTTALTVTPSGSGPAGMAYLYPGGTAPAPMPGEVTVIDFTYNTLLNAWIIMSTNLKSAT